MKPNKFTYTSVLRACDGLEALEQGKQIHGSINKSQFELDIFVGSSLIDLYAKCGSLEIACQLFDKMSERDVVSWSVMIVRHAQSGNANEALELFRQMHLACMKPDSVAMASVIPACANLGALQHDEATHAFLIRSGFGWDVKHL